MTTRLPAAHPAGAEPPARPSWPPASPSRAGCRPLRRPAMRHLSHSSYTRSCCARRTGAATTCSANASPPRRDVPRQPRRRRPHPLLPAHPRARRRLALDQVRDAYRDHWYAELSRRAQARRQLGATTSTSRPRSRSAWTRSSSPSPSSSPGSAGPSPSNASSSSRSRPASNGPSSATSTSRRCARTSGRRLAAAIVDYKVKSSRSLPRQGRPRPAGRPLPRRPLARGRPGARVLLRADRQARPPAQADERLVRHHRAALPGSCAATLARIAQAASQIPALRALRTRRGRGGSPTPPAGSARRATATTTPAAPAARPVGRQPPPPTHSTQQGPPRHRAGPGDPEERMPKRFAARYRAAGGSPAGAARSRPASSAASPTTSAATAGSL